MSQSGITDPAREADWDAWYVEHLRIMRTVRGVSSAQRFRTESAGHPPSLAMYSIASADVFKDPYYLSVRGMGEWLALIDRRYYRRNLFDGLARAPDVAAGDVLLVADRVEPERSGPCATFAWLRAVAIDISTPCRGIAVYAAAEGARIAAAGACACYRPVTTINN